MKDIVGQKFGLLTVIAFDHREIHVRPNGKKTYRIYWKCRCECGSVVVRRRDALNNPGHVVSCGCYRTQVNKTFMEQHNPKASHGLSQTRIYKIYYKMRERCYDKNYPQFDLYGGRGIRICSEWLDDFRNFYDWSISHGYSEDKSIDRIDFNGNYEPKNCRWADVYQQADNKRNNIVLTHDGITMTMPEWARKIGLPYSTLADRRRKGKTVEEILYPKKLR
ncbi:hypothetical protein [Levilactobacillus spicheri]|uniref:Uncharacterized protein n=1 Tax=Levilactobacillus spicheri TaxID=216463 RepID=A0A0F3RSJ8_9LACO|nr:hypothetical protein [Levilactobacillus spicheri]KJW12855.1 hypothetical protein VC81_06295 [Levilactobacillus spicheri]